MATSILSPPPPIPVDDCVSGVNECFTIFLSREGFQGYPWFRTHFRDIIIFVGSADFRNILGPVRSSETLLAPEWLQMQIVLRA